MKPQEQLSATEELIVSRIYTIRGTRVMIDRDLAALYHVETKVLYQAVRRNIRRFPEDFMFQLNSEELANWKSQFVTSNLLNKGLRKNPYLKSFEQQQASLKNRKK